MSSPSKSPLMAALLAQSPSRGGSWPRPAQRPRSRRLPPQRAGAPRRHRRQRGRPSSTSRRTSRPPSAWPSWANWTAYLDYDDKTKKYPTLEAFQKKTGIKATYAEDIDDNDSYYGKIQGQLRTGQDIGKDIIVFTDWMAARVIRAGLRPAAGLSPDAERDEPAARSSRTSTSTPAASTP